MLGRKTHGGFLCQFDFIMPILEQLECGDYFYYFIILVSCLTCLDIVQCGALSTISYSLLYGKKKQSEKDRKLDRFLGNKAVIIIKIAV